MYELASARPVRATVSAIAQLAAAGSLAIGQQPAAFPAEVDAAVAKMHVAMRATSYQDPDAAFVAMMIPHHQGAVDMALAQLRYGKNEQLRRIAQEIIVTQQQEIAAMRLAIGQSSTRSAVTPPPSIPISSISHRDRVYSGDQFSNTVSVVDPADHRLLGVIRLGDPLPGNLSPLYRGQLLVHGLGFSPDHHTIAAVSIGSNSVAFIDTRTNAVKHVTYVGRSPHEAFFTPDGKEVWVTSAARITCPFWTPARMKRSCASSYRTGRACRYSRRMGSTATSARPSLRKPW